MLLLPRFHISNIREHLQFWHITLHEGFKIRFNELLLLFDWRILIIRRLETILIRGRWLGRSLLGFLFYRRDFLNERNLLVIDLTLFSSLGQLFHLFALLLSGSHLLSFLLLPYISQHLLLLFPHFLSPLLSLPGLLELGLLFLFIKDFVWLDVWNVV